MIGQGGAKFWCADFEGGGEILVRTVRRGGEILVRAIFENEATPTHNRSLNMLSDAVTPYSKRATLLVYEGILVFQIKIVWCRSVRHHTFPTM